MAYEVIPLLLLLEELLLNAEDYWDDKVRAIYCWFAVGVACYAFIPDIVVPADDADATSTGADVIALPEFDPVDLADSNILSVSFRLRWLEF